MAVGVLAGVSVGLIVGVNGLHVGVALGVSNMTVSVSGTKAHELRANTKIASRLAKYILARMGRVGL